MAKGILQIEFTGLKTMQGQDELRVKIDGNPNQLAAGLYAAMSNNKDFAAVIIAATVSYAKVQGWTIGQLEYVVTINPQQT